MTTAHVVPLCDLTSHEVPGGIEADTQHPDTGCVCGPDVEMVPNPAGPDGWLVTHHSLDGREQSE